MLIFKKEKRFQIYNLTFHPKKLGDGGQTKPEARGKKEIKIKVKINETANRTEKKFKSMKPKVGSLKRSTKVTNL